MNVFIKSATVIDSKSPFNGKKVDLVIEKGVITEIKAGLKNDKNYKVISSENLYVSGGWCDMQANFCDPGLEHKETLETGIAAAKAGGFTHVCVMPATEPSLSTKSQIDYVVNKTKNAHVSILPVGTLSAGLKGEDLSEMYDMQLSGAIAFSDYKKPIKDAGLLLRALQYSNDIKSFVIAHCNDKSIAPDGKMNEGETSTKLGLKGIPTLSEELMLQRNIAILEYTGGKLHIPSVSSKGSLDLIKQAKAKGLNITCGVSAHNLCFDDSALNDFDTNFKLDPPLRTKDEVEALKKAIANDLIDVIISDHAPQDIESKELEFDLADNGIINLQTAVPSVIAACSKVDLEKVIEKFSIKPYQILGLETPSITLNANANLTLFDSNSEWTFDLKQNESKSRNTPFIGTNFKTKVVASINGSSVFVA